MKHKGIWIAAALVIILLAGVGFNTYDSFHHNGLDQALVGQVEEDRYPDWGKWDSSTKVSRLECDIISKSGLFISGIYLIERANHHQVRLRVGCSMPFTVYSLKCQILEEDFHIRMTLALESEVSLMCNLSKGVEEKGKIYGAITAYKDVMLSEDVIIKKLKEKFRVTEEAAKIYLKEVEKA